MKSRSQTSHRAITVLLVVLAVVTAGATQTGRNVAKRAFPSVALLSMMDARGQPLSLGSGFVVCKGVVATNLHVVRGASKGSAKLIGRETKFTIAGIVAVDAQRDLVLLSVPGVTVDPLALGNSRQVEVGDDVYAIGNPLGLEGTFSQGVVSSIRGVGTDTVLQITAAISPGSSGGPVLDADGRVVGVAAATFKGGQNLNFAIPAAYLKPLVSAIGPVEPLSLSVPSEEGGTIYGDLGRRSVEGVRGEKLTWDFTSAFDFTLRNQLDVTVKDVSCLVIFHDRDGNPLDFDLVECSDPIPPGLAKRVGGYVSSSVKEMTTRKERDPVTGHEYYTIYEGVPATKVEFRVLGFTIVE